MFAPVRPRANVRLPAGPRPNTVTHLPKPTPEASTGVTQDRIDRLTDFRRSTSPKCRGNGRLPGDGASTLGRIRTSPHGYGGRFRSSCRPADGLLSSLQTALLVASALLVATSWTGGRTTAMAAPPLRAVATVANVSPDIDLGAMDQITPITSDSRSRNLVRRRRATPFARVTGYPHRRS